MKKTCKFKIFKYDGLVPTLERNIGYCKIGFMREKIHPKYEETEIRCACGNTFKTRSTRKNILVGICYMCHPFYTGSQKLVDTAGRVDKFQQRMAKTKAAQEKIDALKKKK